MFYGTFGPEFAEEGRAQIRREVRRHRLEARLTAALAERDAAPGEPARRGGFVARGAAGGVAPFR